WRWSTSSGGRQATSRRTSGATKSSTSTPYSGSNVPSTRRMAGRMTKYRRTMELILRMIDEQELAPGDRLPTEPELAQLAGVSMITLRRAIGELVARGMLVRRQGRGTFVAR